MKQVPETVEQVKERGIKPYPQLDVVLTYQNFGSCWMGVMRGSTDNINNVFNGLFNLCATNGECQFYDHLQTVGVFWTSRNAMRRFFFNQKHIAEPSPNGRTIRRAMRYALGRIEALRESGHEFFMDFRQFMPEIYSNGTITAERPDADMKDAILANAFADKEVDKR